MGCRKWPAYNGRPLRSELQTASLRCAGDLTRLLAEVPPRLRARLSVRLERLRHLAANEGEDSPIWRAYRTPGHPFLRLYVGDCCVLFSVSGGEVHLHHAVRAQLAGPLLVSSQP